LDGRIFFITLKLTALHTGSHSHSFCWRQCETSMGNHYHIFWACPKINLFLQEVVAEIGKIVGVVMDFSFTTAYLGKIPGNVLDKDKYLLKILLTVNGWRWTLQLRING